MDTDLKKVVEALHSNCAISITLGKLIWRAWSLRVKDPIKWIKKKFYDNTAAPQQKTENKE